MNYDLCPACDEVRKIEETEKRDGETLVHLDCGHQFLATTKKEKAA